MHPPELAPAAPDGTRPAANAPANSAELLHAVIRDVDEPVIITHPTTLRVTYANQRATTGTPWTPETAVGRHLWEMSAGLDSDRLRSVAAGLRADGPGADMEHRSVVEDRFHHWRLHIRLVEAGGNPQLVVVAHDVTALREAEDDLREREAQYRHLAEESSGIVYRARLRPEVGLEYLSPRLREVLGDRPADVLADPEILLSRIHPDDGHPFNDPSRHAAGVHTYRVRHADGHWVTIEDRHRPVLDRMGRTVASHGVLFDVTERAELERVRARALEHERELSRRLELAAEAQRRFLQSVSHEVRTPLTAVRGFTHTLERHLDDLDPEVAHDLLARLKRNVNRLDGLLADVLELGETRHETTAGDERLALGDLCREVVGSMDTSSHDVTLQTSPVAVRGDGLQLRRVVRALVANAVRHTPAGTAVSIRTDEMDGWAVLEVADDGPGVDPRVRDRMFEAFTQGPDAAAAASPGTGIGLALARTLVAGHGGTLRHEPGEGGGACFRVRLPLADTVAGAPPAGQPIESRNASTRSVTRSVAIGS